MKEKIFNGISYLVLILGLLLTFILWRASEQHQQAKQEEFFSDLARKTHERLLTRIQTYLDAHQAGVGLFRSVHHIDRDQWQTFVNVLNLTFSYPGINGLGYAVPVLKEDSVRFIQKARQEVSPDFKIHSLNLVPKAPDLFVIKFIEPLDRNLPAVGLDMGSEPKRREAMEKARNQKVPTITRKVTLVQDKAKSPGFLMYVPIFDNDAETGLKTNFLGWVYSPFIARNFVEGVLKYELSEGSQYFNIALYDGTEADTANLLYANNQADLSNRGLVYRRNMPVLGNNWTIVISATDKFLDTNSHSQPWIIIVSGVALSLLLFLLLHNLAETRKRALALAEKMTLEYSNLNRELDQKVNERTSELAEKNKKLNLYTEHLKNAYEDLETKVKFRNRDLEKQINRLNEEIASLKNNPPQT